MSVILSNLVILKASRVIFFSPGSSVIVSEPPGKLQSKAYICMQLRMHVYVMYTCITSAIAITHP